MANFDLTVLHHTLEDGKTYPAPECFVPRDLGYKECELIRSMMTEVDVQTFPKEIQQSLAWGQKLTIDAEVCVLEIQPTLLITPDPIVPPLLISLSLYPVPSYALLQHSPLPPKRPQYHRTTKPQLNNQNPQPPNTSLQINSRIRSTRRLPLATKNHGTSTRQPNPLQLRRLHISNHAILQP